MEQENIQQHLDNFYRMFGEYETELYHRDQSKTSSEESTLQRSFLSSRNSDPPYFESPDEFFTRIYEEIGTK